MKHRVIFGKPLPRALLEKPASIAGLVVAGVILGAIGWFVAMLAAPKSRESEDMVYVWPD